MSREGSEALTKVSADPSPPASAPACNVLNVVDTLHDVWHDVCADSGATEDVLYNRCGVEATNIKQVDDIILMGMGGEVASAKFPPFCQVVNLPLCIKTYLCY